MVIEPPPRIKTVSHGGVMVIVLVFVLVLVLVIVVVATNCYYCFFVIILVIIIVVVVVVCCCLGGCVWVSSVAFRVLCGCGLYRVLMCLGCFWVF